MAVLSDDEVRSALAGLAGWELVGDRIAKEYRLADFREAVAFVVRLAFPAEAADHHPDLELHYNRVKVLLSTHSAGGVTAKDVELARAIEALATGGG